MGNATDRNPASGTNGTGEPAPAATGTAASATQLDTIAPSGATSGTAPLALTGTTDINAQKSDTTSTLQGVGGTTTASVATPTATTETVTTPAKKKH
jgi:hypothetical protein